MTAANVTNNHTGPLFVGNVNIPAGATARVEGWESVKLSNAVQTWIGADILDVVEEEPIDVESKIKTVKSLPPVVPSLPGLPGLSSADDDNDAKDALIAELATFGIEKTRRSSVENLQKELDAAKAAKA